jgi:hypothetical protein
MEQLNSPTNMGRYTRTKQNYTTTTYYLPQKAKKKLIGFQIQIFTLRKTLSPNGNMIGNYLHITKNNYFLQVGRLHARVPRKKCFINKFHKSFFATSLSL